jgi:hypothetical protein
VFTYRYQATQVPSRDCCITTVLHVTIYKYNEAVSPYLKISRVEAESNASTVTLRVVGGDEKGVSDLRQENIVSSPMGLGPENDCAGEGHGQL